MRSLRDCLRGLIISIFAALACSLLFVAIPSQAAVSLRGNNNEEKIFYYLMESTGFNNAGSAGVLANILYESSFNPKASGDNGTSYGICQWHGTRFEALKRYCSREGYDYTSLEGQLTYLNYELSTDSYFKSKVYVPIYSVNNSADGAYNSGYIWCYYFENPSDKDSKAVTRGNVAKNTYYPKYKDIILSLVVGETYETDEGKFVATSADTVSFKAMKNKKATSLTIPNTVEIGSVTAKVTEISAGACKNKKLQSLTIGKNVTKIGDKAFFKCKKLSTIKIKSKKITEIGSKAFIKIKSDATFYVNKKVKSKYKKLLKNTAPSKITIKKG